jgi:hypothetical protein
VELMGYGNKEQFKRKRYLIMLLFAVVLTALCLVPAGNPVVAADGGTRIYYPLIPVYGVVDWNRMELSPYPGKTTKGIQVFIFRICVYDGRYTVEGMQPRR